MAVIRIKYDFGDSSQDIAEITRRIEELEKANEELTDELDDLKKKTKENEKATADFNNEVKSATNNITFFGIGLGDASEKLVNATKSTKGLSVALKALPLLAVASALASVATFLTSTQRGQERLRVATARTNAVLSVFRDRLSQAGENLLTTTENGIKSESAFSKLFGTLLKTNPVVAAFTTSIGLAKAALPELTQEINEEIEAAGRLERQLIENEKAQIDLDVARAQANATIEQSKLLAEDLTQTNEIRAAAAQRALDTETELLNREIELARERVQILADQQALGENTIEDVRELAEARIELANIEQTSLTRQIELNNKLNAIRKEQFEAERERFEEVQDIRSITLEQDEEDLEKRLEQIQIAKDAELKAEAELMEKQKLRNAEQERLNQERLQAELDTLDTLVTTSAGLIGRLTGFGKATAIVQATIDTFAGANKAFQQGGVLGFITGAAIIAQGLANVATIRAQELPQFASGVIDLKGPGTETSDSITARLSKGESVMTAQETREFLPTLKAIRKGDIDPELLNGISNNQMPEVIDASKIIHVDRSSITIDQNGFTEHLVKRGNRIRKKQNKYRSNLFA